MPAPQHSVLALRVEVMRVTQRTAISWTLLEMMVVTRGTLAVMMRWLAVFLLFLGSLGVCLPNSLGTERSVSGYFWGASPGSRAPGASCRGRPCPSPCPNPCL